LTEDRFPGDDVRYGLADVRGVLQVAVAGLPDDATARIWTRAAQALESVAVRRLTPEQLATSTRDDLLFLAGWNGQTSVALTEHLQRGGALIVQPAEGLDVSAARASLGLAPAPAPETPLGIEVRDAPGWALQVADEEHPVMQLFTRGAYGDPVRAHFRRRSNVPAFVTGKPLLAFEDGRPGLTFFAAGPERRATVAWWNLDLGATDWPTRSAFVSFFGEFVRHVSTRLAAPSLREFEPGARLRHELAATFDPAGVRLVDERDQSIPVAAESPRTPGRLASKLPSAPGSYRWMAQDGVLDRATVNFPETESDLRRLTPAELAQGGGELIASTAGARIAGLREGRPLWPWCLVAAALLLLVEGWCAWRFPSRTQTRVAPTSPKPQEEVAAA
jgi:hypothetical protein